MLTRQHLSHFMRDTRDNMNMRICDDRHLHAHTQMQRGCLQESYNYSILFTVRCLSYTNLVTLIPM